MECFKKLGLIEPIIKSIEEQRFTEPSEIQRDAIPIVLEGRDVIAGSATGSGKTLVFGSGIIQNCSKGRGIQALVLTPTRELAEQVAESLRGFSRYKPLKTVAVYGGVAIGPQFRDLKTADVVIGALRPINGRTPVVVTNEMVSQMKFGSVIIDVSIDRGGCFETSETTTHDNPTYQKYGVIHYGVPNIASRVAKTASMALSNIFLPILHNMGQAGGCENTIKTDAGFRHAVYLFQGSLTNDVIASVFDLPYKNIDLLIATLLVNRRFRLFLFGFVLGIVLVIVIYGEK